MQTPNRTPAATAPPATPAASPPRRHRQRRANSAAAASRSRAAPLHRGPERQDLTGARGQTTTADAPFAALATSLLRCGGQKQGKPEIQRVSIYIYMGG